MSFSASFLALFLPISATAQVVINEIHYNPDIKTDPAEFVELHNRGTSAVDVSGWNLSEGTSFTFPATNIAAGGYLVVAQNPAFCFTKFGVRALGPFMPNGGSFLSSTGEKVTLRNAAGQVVDEVDYGSGFPWPTVGDPLTETAPGTGSSIELIHPSLDNDLGGSWRSSLSAGSPGNSQTLLADRGSWKYFKGTTEASSPATAWRQTGFDDSSWLSGGLPIGYGETFIVTPLTDMTGGYTTVFLRKTFTVSDPSQFTQLLLQAQYDDGFKVWINGVNVIDNQANMPAGEVPNTGSAVSALENLNFVSFNLTAVPSGLLVSGNNLIAVQAANSSLASSGDFFFDCRLLGQSGGSSGGGPTPGRVNTVFATNAPPQIRQVDHSPEQPGTGQSVNISAKVTDPNGVGSVLLEYQVVRPGSYVELTDSAYTNAANWTSLPMNDVGTNGDALAGDDVFTATIPASAQLHRTLVRYRITVADALNRSVRVPYADDPQPNFAYFVYDGVPGWRGAVQPGAAGSNGVVVNFPSEVMGRLPVYHLIGKSNTIATATWFSRYGGDAYQWQGALVYDGKVYDHIRYRARGGVWRYSMVKNMWKFDLNRGHEFEARDNWGQRFKTKWAKLNLGASIQQGDFEHRGEQGMFESVGFRMFQLVGTASPHTTFATFRVIDHADEASPTTQYEGDFWGVYLAIEQEDGRFLDEHDLPDSNFYKMEGGTGDLNNLGPNGPTDKSDLNYMLQNYSGKAESWWRTNWNLPKYYSYQAIVQAIHHYDICYDKNFFYYFDPRTRLWEITSWDLDLIWADNMYDAGCGGKDRVYQRVFDETNPAKPNIAREYRNRVREVRDLLFNSDEAFRLIDEYAALLRGPTNAPTLLDADRMTWDYNPKMISSTYTPNLGKAGQGRFYSFPLESGTNSSLRGSFNATIRIMKHYVGRRGAFMDNIANEPLRPNRPTVSYTGPSNYPINRLTFRSSNFSAPGGGGTFAAMKWRIGEITDTNAPSYRADEPQKYEIEASWESGALTAFSPDINIPPEAVRTGSRYRVRVQFIDNMGRASNWSPPHEFTCGEPENLGDLLNYLRITEIMFNPPPGGFEFVELHNLSSSVTLDLAGVKFTQGIDFTCGASTTIPPGGYLVVIGTPDIAAFRAYYGLDTSVPIVAAFTGSLNNGGEQLVLRTAAGGTDIVAFNYSDGRGWPPAADGAGHSLIFSDSALGGQGSGSGEYGGNWRPSRYLKGSPGRADTPAATTLVLNEIVAHTDFLNEFDSNDWIELFNTTDSDVTLGVGWYLSDDNSNLKKWMIPAATVVPARGWVSFDEQTGFHNPTNIGFGLSKDGEQVFLSYLPGTIEDRVVDAVSFKAQENDWSLGRYPDGGPFWYQLTPRTRDLANAAPGNRVVISEILFHPPDIGGTNDNSLDEFIEIYNDTGASVQFWNTNRTWRLDGGVNFDFPTNLTLVPDQFLLVVNFNPATNASQLAAFRSLYDITNKSLVILGPYNGKLANNSDRVALEKPLTLTGPGDYSWIVVDEVIYADQAPWPCGADGSGNSLQRLASSQHGNDPANWSSEPPTAGRPRANLPAGLPAITQQPQTRIVGTNGSASFSVAVCGTPPFTYQWQFNGTNIAGATNPILNLFKVQLAAAGWYSVVVANSAGEITSEAAQLIVQLPPFVIEQPNPYTVIRDQTATFNVTAGGTAPLSYQWQRNGVNLSGANSGTLILTNVQASEGGNYTVVVFNAAGAVVSSNAALTVLIPATITNQPVSRTVTNGVNVTMSVGAYGTGTLRYQWSKDGQEISGATNSSLLITNIQIEHAGTYRVVVRDQIGPAVSQPAALTVLVRPRILIQPVSQSVAQSGTVTFGVMAEGTLPMGFRWRRAGQTVAFYIQSENTSFYTETNVQSGAAYTVVATNIANFTGILSATANLTVLTDSDGDGLPDAWEANYMLGTNNPTDAAVDSDGDGLTNSEEYQAGTDPRDPLSYLKIEQVRMDGADISARLTFYAVSNKTYTVQCRDVLMTGGWFRVSDVLASASNRVVEVLHPSGGDQPQRFYRFVTPRIP